MFGKSIYRSSTMIGRLHFLISFKIIYNEMKISKKKRKREMKKMKRLFEIHYMNKEDYSKEDILKDIKNNNKNNIIKDNEINKYSIDYIIFDNKDLKKSIIQFIEFFNNHIKDFYNNFEIDDQDEFINYMIKNEYNLIYFDNYFNQNYIEMKI